MQSRTPLRGKFQELEGEEDDEEELTVVGSSTSGPGFLTKAVGFLYTRSKAVRAVGAVADGVQDALWNLRLQYDYEAERVPWDGYDEEYWSQVADTEQEDWSRPESV